MLTNLNAFCQNYKHFLRKKIFPYVCGSGVSPNVDFSMLVRRGYSLSPLEWGE